MTNPDMDTFEPVLGHLSYAIALSDMTQSDHPVVYMNTSFKTLTGCTDRHLGQNCRFLQVDCENKNARLEIKRALYSDDHAQVLLCNRRMDGQAFFNMLLVDVVGAVGPFENLALGMQFELSTAEAAPLFRDAAATQTWGIRTRDILDQNLRLRIEQRRTAFASAALLLKS